MIAGSTCSSATPMQCRSGRRRHCFWGTWVVLSFFCILGCGDSGEALTTDEAQWKVIYGRDDREELYAYPIGSPIYTWARSSAMQIVASDLVGTKDTGFVLAVEENFAESMRAGGRPLCCDEPFRDQPILGGVCSAFLVAPDTVITAGHCIGAPGACPHMAYVFGVAYDVYDQESRDPRLLGADDVYFCKDVLKQIWNRARGDYAVVKLDRPVAGRAPLPLRRVGKVEDDEELILIGNPLGLPTKIAAHGKVLDNTPTHYFKANTDSYGGGSGSVVIGARSGLVEGVLVRGEKDFVQRGDCWVSKVCPEGASSCRGEDVSRAVEFAVYVP